jgi:hypothetical protein
MCAAIPYTQRSAIGPSTKTFSSITTGSAWTYVGPVIHMTGVNTSDHR